MAIDLNRTLEDFDLIFIDLETTGLDVVTGDSICEIGAFKIRQRKTVDKFHSLINPRKDVPKEAYQIHKISNEELKKAPYFEEIADKLMSFLENSVICAYNVGFDMGFLNHHLKDMDYIPLSNPAIDILSMARDVLDLSRYNLEATAKFFNIDCNGKLHRALEDAVLAYEIFKRLADIFKEKKIQKLGEFLSLYGLNNEIFIAGENKKVTFIKEAIDNKSFLRLRYFSSANIIRDEKAIPLRLFRENKNLYLLCQGPGENSSRIRLNRILEAEHA